MKFLKGGPDQENHPPRFRDDPSQCVSVPEDVSAILSVELYEFSDDTEIIWSKDGGAPIIPERRRQLRISNNTIQLALDRVHKEDAGLYTVTAKSPLGVASRDVELRVGTAEDGDEPPAFLRRLNDLSVKVGTRTRFLVEIRSNSTLVIEWLKNEERITEGERYRFVNEGGFHCVDVAPVTTKDIGRWNCTARNKCGQASSSCHLNVLVPKTYKTPEFLEELRALLTEQGTVSLECKVVGVPTPALRWFKDGREIHAGDVFALTANPNDPTSLGVYVCEAVNCMGKAVSSSKVHVVDSKQDGLKPVESHLPTGPSPIFTRDLQDESIKIGDPILLTSQVSVPPWPKSIQWYNSEGRIDDNESGSRYKQMADGIGGYMLEVKPTEASDQGEWKCVATSDTGVVSISTCTVNMIIPKHFRKPRFMDTLKAVLTEEGLVSFECKVVGSPTPLLRWFKDGQELKPGDVYQLTGTNSLGSYCCIAKNCMGEARSSAELTVEDIENQLNEEEREQLIARSQAPKFIQGLKSSEGKINEPFRFTIQVSVATPLPLISWFRDDQPVTNEPEKYIVFRENLGVCHLDVRPVELNDQAEWKCVATNDFGHSVTSCFLKITIPKHFRKPKFLECLRAVLSEEGAVNLECKVIGVPQPVLKWYKDGIELKPGDIHRITSGQDGRCCLGTYTCEARNCMGTVASSASLLGFEDQKMKGIQSRPELGRQLSLSTIHEERTSQMYDTAGDQSITLADHGEVSFSFDGKEVSVSLYETPDLTEDEALQIVEMYAEQLSEHFSEHNIVELPPLRFVKESSQTGNLLMEAVVVDVSDEYFHTAEEDLRTEADVDEILSITNEPTFTSEKLKIDLTSSGEAPKRPPRKSDSQKSNSYYSLTQNPSMDSEKGDESLAGAAELDTESYGEYESAISSEKNQLIQEAGYQVAAITETTSLPGDDDRRPLTPHTAHEIGSDLRVNRSESQEIKKSTRRRSSQSSDEMSKDGFKRGAIKKAVSLEITDTFHRDLQGEEGDGLVIDPKVNAIKIRELIDEENKVVEQLQITLDEILKGLRVVQDNLLIQSAEKSSSTAADRSTEVLNGISQPIKDIKTIFETFQQRDTRPAIYIVELVAPSIFDLQKSLIIVENCINIKRKEHTLIQKTCSNILKISGTNIQKALSSVEEIAILEKELNITQATGRMTPSKIIQEVCITIKEMETKLDKLNFALAEKSSTSPETSSRRLSTTKDIDVLDKLINAAMNIKTALESLEETVAYDDSEQMYATLGVTILDKLQDPVEILVKEMKVIQKEAIRYTTEKSLQQEIRRALLDNISTSVDEISKSLNVIKVQEPGDRHAGVISLNVLESLVTPVESVIHSLTRIKNHAVTAKQESEELVTSDEVFTEVLDKVTKLVFSSITEAIEELRLSIDTAKINVSDSTILEALSHLSILQRNLVVTVTEASKFQTHATVTALENLNEPIHLLNSLVRSITPTTGKYILEDSVNLLNILEDCVIVDDTILLSMDLCILFSILRGKIYEVRENISSLIEQGSLIKESKSEENVVVILEEQSPTVISEALIEDTKVTLELLNERCIEPYESMLDPFLERIKDLNLAITDELLVKNKSELVISDRVLLQKHVIPLEMIEDLIIGSLDVIATQSPSESKQEIFQLLQHLQYNVAVMHQQVMDETQHLEVIVQCGEENIKELLTKVNVVKDLLCQEGNPEMTAVAAENIYELGKSLAMFYEIAMSEHNQNIPSDLYAVASEVLDHIEEIKNNEQDIIKLQEPLRKLEKYLRNIQQDQEFRQNVFASIRNPLIEINEMLEIIPDDLKIRLFTLYEPLRNTIEIISLETFNFNIQNSDLEPLSTISELLNKLRSSIPVSSNILDISFILEELAPCAEELLNTLKEIKNEQLRHIIFSLSEFVVSILDLHEHLKETEITYTNEHLEKIENNIGILKTLPHTAHLQNVIKELEGAIEVTNVLLAKETASDVDDILFLLDIIVENISNNLFLPSDLNTLNTLTNTIDNFTIISDIDILFAETLRGVNLVLTDYIKVNLNEITQAESLQNTIKIVSESSSNIKTPLTASLQIINDNCGLIEYDQAQEIMNITSNIVQHFIDNNENLQNDLMHLETIISTTHLPPELTEAAHTINRIITVEIDKNFVISKIEDQKSGLENVTGLGTIQNMLVENIIKNFTTLQKTIPYIDCNNPGEVAFISEIIEDLSKLIDAKEYQVSDKLLDNLKNANQTDPIITELLEDSINSLKRINEETIDQELSKDCLKSLKNILTIENNAYATLISHTQSLIEDIDSVIPQMEKGSSTEHLRENIDNINKIMKRVLLDDSSSHLDEFQLNLEKLNLTLSAMNLPEEISPNIESLKAEIPKIKSITQSVTLLKTNIPHLEELPNTETAQALYRENDQLIQKIQTAMLQDESVYQLEKISGILHQAIHGAIKEGNNEFIERLDQQVTASSISLDENIINSFKNIVVLLHNIMEDKQQDVEMQKTDIEDQVQTKIEPKIEIQKVDLEPQVSTNIETQMESQIESQIETQIKPQTETQIEPQIGPQTDTEIKSQIEIQIETQIKPQIETQIEPQIETQIEPQIGVQTETEIESQIKSEIETKIEPQIETQIEPQIGPQTETEIKTQIETQIEPQVGAQTESEIKTEIETQIETQIEIKIEPQIETEIEPQLGAQAETEITQIEEQTQMELKGLKELRQIKQILDNKEQVWSVPLHISLQSIINGTEEVASIISTENIESAENTLEYLNLFIKGITQYYNNEITYSEAISELNRLASAVETVKIFSEFNSIYDFINDAIGTGTDLLENKHLNAIKDCLTKELNDLQETCEKYKNQNNYRNIFPEGIYYAIPIILSNITDMSKLNETELNYIENATGMITLIRNFITSEEYNITNQQISIVSDFLDRNRLDTSIEFLKHLNLLINKSLFLLNDIKEIEKQNEKNKMENIQLASDSLQNLLKRIAAINIKNIDKNKVIHLQKCSYVLQTAIYDLLEKPLNEQDNKFLENITKIFEEIDYFISEMLSVESSSVSHRNQVQIFLKILNEESRAIDDNSTIKTISQLINNFVEVLPDILNQLEIAHSENIKTSIINVLLNEVDSEKDSMIQLTVLKTSLDKFTNLCLDYLTELENNIIVETRSNIEAVQSGLDINVTTIREQLSQTDSPICEFQRKLLNIFEDVKNKLQSSQSVDLKSEQDQIKTDAQELEEEKPVTEEMIKEQKDHKIEEIERVTEGSIEVDQTKTIHQTAEEKPISEEMITEDKEVKIAVDLKENIEDQIKTEVEIAHESKFIAEETMADTKEIKMEKDVLSNVNENAEPLIEKDQIKREVQTAEELEIEKDISDEIKQETEALVEKDQVQISTEMKPISEETDNKILLDNVKQDNEGLIEKDIKTEEQIIEEKGPVTENKDFKMVKEIDASEKEEQKELVEKLHVAQEESSQAVESQKDEVIETKEENVITEDKDKQDTENYVENVKSIPEAKDQIQITKEDKDIQSLDIKKELNLDDGESKLEEDQNKKDEEIKLISEIQKTQEESIIENKDNKTLQEKLIQEQETITDINEEAVIEAPKIETQQMVPSEESTEMAEISEDTNLILESSESEIIVKTKKEEIEAVQPVKECIVVPQIESILHALNHLSSTLCETETQAIPELKKIALNELQKSLKVVEETIRNKFIHSASDTDAEKEALTEANNTLNILNNYIQNQKESIQSLTAENVKAAIEELRLTVVVLPKESEVKIALEQLEETVKNVINLVENIPLKTEETLRILCYIEKLTEVVEIIKSDATDEQNPILIKLENLLKAVEISAGDITINSELEQNILGLINDSLDEFNDILQFLNKYSKIADEDVINSLRNKNLFLNNELVNLPRESSIIPLGEKITNIGQTITSLLSLDKSSVCTQLQDFQNSIIKLQDSLNTDVPGPIPSQPTVIESGRNWLCLSWEKPEQKTTVPVLAYRVEMWTRGAEGARWIEVGVTPLTSFDIFNLKPEIEYQFRITPRNRYGWGESVQSGVTTLGRPTSLPEFTKVLPGQHKALLGSEVTLECEVQGEPIPSIRWIKDSQEIFPEDDQRYDISQDGHTCSFKISNVQSSDSGRFMCEATNKVGRVSTFARLSVVKDPKLLTAESRLRFGVSNFNNTDPLPPQFTMRLRDRRVEMTYPVRLTCQIIGLPVPAIKWYKDGQEVVEDDRHSFFTDDNFHTLEITKTHLDDSGTYSISADNYHGSVSCRCNLVVDKGIKDYMSPIFLNLLAPADAKVKEGGELRWTARVEAYPGVGLAWFKDGVRLRPSRRYVMTLSYDGIIELSIGKILKNDFGLYTCVVSNEVGRAQSTARIEVLDKELSTNESKNGIVRSDIPYSKEPKFLKKPRSSEAYEGDNIVILCEVIGDPTPDVLWLRDFLKPDYYRDAAHFHRVDDGPEYRLEIPNAKIDYTGTYTVYAKNCRGDAKAIISLQIKVKVPKPLKTEMGKKKIADIQTIPQIVKELCDIRCCDGDSATLECKVFATPAPDVRWEKGGKLIHLGDDFNADFDGETARLSINQVYPEDEGEYACVAYNELGKAFTSACLIVDLPEEKENILTQQLKRPTGFVDVSTPNLSTRPTSNRSLSPLPTYRERGVTEFRSNRIRAAPPKFYAYPHNRVAEQGETVRFQCAVAGHPDPWVTWEKDGVVVTPSARLRITEREDLRTLEISDVIPSDSGVYKIILENDVGRIETSAKLDVIGHRSVSLRGLRARSLSPKPAPYYSNSFLGDYSGVGSRPGLYSNYRSTLASHYKYYKDSVTDDANTSRPDIIKCLPKNVNVAEGRSVCLEIEVVGTPPLDVVWMKNGCILPDCIDFQQKVTGDGLISLYLPDVYPEDSGNYRCEIYNLYGDAFSTCNLTVEDTLSNEPRIKLIRQPLPVTTREGGNASFAVQVQSTTGDKPIVQWEVGGKTVIPSGKFQIEEAGDVNILRIVGVTKRDVGPVNYSLLVRRSSNSSDQPSAVPIARYATNLAIFDLVDSGTNCGDSGASMEEVVQAEETAAKLLRGPQDTTALVGDRVLLKATYKGIPEPKVQWNKAGRELKNDERTSITSGDGVSCLLLQNITADDSGKYDISVKNLHGEDCNYASLAVEGAPDPPSGTPCITTSSDCVTVTWSSSPYDGGKIVNGYAVEYTLVGSDIWTTAVDECHSLSYVVRNLQPGGRYVFRVRALNVHGYSRPSVESDIVQLEEHNESSFFEPRIVSVEPGPEFKTRYEVLEELGKGRYGVVHKVVDKESNQKFAAKFIKCRTSKDRDKVQDEIDIMNLLRHQKLLQLAAAFENPRDMIMIMEYISGGELFERVVADDFTLTEKDCILFMRQICEGVAYMHTQHIVHLDLKPENIMCHTRTSHEIKIIDFGLAQKLNPKEPVRVLFGTPEFIPPEIIGYEPIGIESDMWSIGVICYVLLSGLSPFMGDNDSDTFANITRADYDFEDEAFNTVSQNARDFIGALLIKRKENRLSAEQCLKHIWLDPETHQETVVLSTDKLKKFIIRRKWQVDHLRRQTA